MNGTINLKKLATKILDAIFTLNTQMEAVDGKVVDAITRNNEQTLAIVEYNADASSKDYNGGDYIILNGKLYKTLGHIAQGDPFQEDVNIQWVRVLYEINKLKGDLKTGAYSTVSNNANTSIAGYVLDARMGKTLNDSITTLNTKVTQLTGKLVMDYHKDIRPVDGNGKPYTTIKANTSVWLTLPVTKTGYHPVGILGYYMYSYSTGSYCANNCVYQIGPSPQGATMAVTTSSKGDWINPRLALYILWQKN